MCESTFFFLARSHDIEDEIADALDHDPDYSNAHRSFVRSLGECDVEAASPFFTTAYRATRASLAELAGVARHMVRRLAHVSSDRAEYMLNVVMLLVRDASVRELAAVLILEDDLNSDLSRAVSTVVIQDLRPKPPECSNCQPSRSRPVRLHLCYIASTTQVLVEVRAAPVPIDAGAATKKIVEALLLCAINWRTVEGARMGYRVTALSAVLDNASSLDTHRLSAPPTTTWGRVIAGLDARHLTRLIAAADLRDRDDLVPKPSYVTGPMSYVPDSQMSHLELMAAVTQQYRSADGLYRRLGPEATLVQVESDAREFVVTELRTDFSSPVTRVHGEFLPSFRYICGQSSISWGGGCHSSVLLGIVADRDCDLRVSESFMHASDVPVIRLKRGVPAGYPLLPVGKTVSFIVSPDAGEVCLYGLVVHLSERARAGAHWDRDELPPMSWG